jgi:hypothetical protein
VAKGTRGGFNNEDDAMFLFVQSWDIVKGKDREYTDFLLRQHLPVMKKVGLNVIGGFHVVVGAGPNISAVIASNDFQKLLKALDTEEFLDMTKALQEFTVNYSSRIFKHTKRVEVETYGIELGTWRLNQYYTMIPGMEGEYSDFLVNRYFPILLDQGIRIKAEWQGVVGSGPHRILLEGVSQNIQDIARLLASDEFRTAKHTLLSGYVKQYSSRILAPTGRVETALILGEMTKAL